MTIEKFRTLPREFLKIFLLFLAVRIGIQLINHNPLSVEQVLKEHIPLAAIFAFLFALIRQLLRPTT